MRLLLLTAFGMLAYHEATAQTRATGADSVSQWGWSIRVGLGAATSQHGDYRREYSEVAAGPLVGVGATRYFAGPLVSLAAEALLTRCAVVVDFRQQDITAYTYHPAQTLHQWRLFTPVYVRTSSPAKGLHLLVGAGPTFALGHSGHDAAYYPRPVELTGMVGLEVRVLPWHRYETTLGLRVHAPLTPSYAYGYLGIYNNPSGGVTTHEARHDVYSRWLGVTLATTLYPAATRKP
ncbi:hypothetical protein Q3A66_00405 [Hymenobacter sp. BT770]|uniref:hypothetical protein n=1 Tax=Hymenobacter sp. BT770 TaxID=2886942 RepID=UPI001D11154C|nr:hypothetical protein [Hymenobacter sp. BT770]MCC3151870.1 hypothetical protein [Hymenobacter sp. BT770]MDO3413508.1 hypothetical protein [Hymenobacter sp. BT770]